MNIEKIDFSNKFIKSLNKLAVKERKLYLRKYEWLVKDVFDPRLKTHKLTGKLNGLWSFSISHQYRVIFEFVDERSILCHEVGTHGVYK